MLGHRRCLEQRREPELPLVSSPSVRNIIELHEIDKYTFLVTCPIVLLFQAVLIAAMLKYRMLGHSP
jgi:hypothetical protein